MGLLAVSLYFIIGLQATNEIHFISQLIVPKEKF